jgi:hypothetical protein
VASVHNDPMHPFVRDRLPTSTIMASSNGQVITRHEQIADLAGAKRAGHTIPQVDGAIDVAMLMSASTASSAGMFPWMSAMIAIRMSCTIKQERCVIQASDRGRFTIW